MTASPALSTLEIVHPLLFFFFLLFFLVPLLIGNPLSGNFLVVNLENFHSVFKKSICLSTWCPLAAFVRTWVDMPSSFSLFEQDVSLRKRVGCFRNCATFLNTRCRFYLRGVALLCFDGCPLRQVIFVLHDGEEDAETVHRLDQLANHADGLGALVEVYAFFVPFRLRGSCSKIVVAGTPGCPDSFTCACLDLPRRPEIS